MKLRTLLVGAVTLGAVAFAVGIAPRSSGAAVPPNPGVIKLDLGDAQQLVVVTSAGWKSTIATVALFERAPSGKWHRVGVRMNARVGKNGFSASHHEGDGTSPAGSWGIVSAFGRQPDPGLAMPYRQTQPGDCWISDVNSSAYNRWVAQAPCDPPNEDLYAIGIGAYRYALVTDYNQDVTVGAGSAIFLHRHSYASNGTTRPTSGCVSLVERDLLTTMRWLNPAKHPRVVMGPAIYLTTGP
jgi:L,D-peptidoglycan transpeptidase YkuD (ErfK/YbiS/YcfS/YnhG family)